MVLPEQLRHLIWQNIEESIKSPKYIKVILKLQDLLEGEFFNEYIKLGKFHDLDFYFFYHFSRKVHRQHHDIAVLSPLAHDA